MFSFRFPALTPAPLANSTDELCKSSTYLTDTHYLNSTTKYSTLPTRTQFNFAFGTGKGYFGCSEKGAGEAVGQFCVGEEEADAGKAEEGDEEGVWLTGPQGMDDANGKRRRRRRRRRE